MTAVSGLRSIKRIRFDADGLPSLVDGAGRDLGGIGQLSGVNVFVGANNSGKSWVLRSLASLSPRHYSCWNDPAGENSEFQVLSRRLCEMLDERGIVRWGTVQRQELDVKVAEWTPATEDPYAPVRQLLATLKAPNSKGTFEEERRRGQIQERHAHVDQLERERELVAQALADRLREKPGPVVTKEPEVYYVPVLRGLRRLGLDGSGLADFDDVLGNRTRADYFGGSRENPVTRTGESLFGDVRRALLGLHAERARIRRYEKFLSTRFFDGAEISLVPNETSGCLHISIDSEDRPVHQLGDGLHSVLILTFDSFVRADEPCLFFIEEPELYLHPGMQRRLVEFFCEQENHVFFLASHSNHLLDMSVDYQRMSVFNFQRVRRAGEAARFRVEQVDRGDESSLRLLGVRDSSVFLVNATVWVEGVTDRLYFRKMLAMYMAQQNVDAYEEDVHFSFVEYGGANITHWSFLEKEDHPINVERLCGRLCLIADQDDPTAREERHAALRERLEQRFLTTAGREVENMLPERVVRGVVAGWEQVERAALGPITRVGGYRDERLGIYLADKVEDLLPSTRRKYATKGGALQPKQEFCDAALRELDDLAFDDLDADVQELIVAIYGHIAAMNSDR